MGEVATPDMNSDFFDQIDDFLEFPTEDVDAAMPGGGDSVQSWPTDDIFSLRSSTFGDFRGGCDDPEHELAVPCDNLAELEWLSNFVEDSFSVGSIQTEFQNSINGGFRSSSPVSVLESSSCSSKTLDVLPSVPGRARTKRPRPPVLPPRPASTTSGNANNHTMMISPSSSTTTFSGQYRPASKSFVESEPAKKSGGRKRKRAEQTGISLRKCLHCESQKTPQWRAGPLGPKTLCNACGVRYKSGRLFPEYRPAASPTFQAAQHSNSHKKVMEMRVKRRPMAGGGHNGDTELVYQRNTILNYM